MINEIKKDIQESINIHNSIFLDEKIFEKLYNIALKISQCFENNGQVYICGNGGLAAEAMHFSSEFLGRFKLERKALTVVSLNADPAVITSIANDYGYEHIFSRQLHGILQKNDVLITLSTSGNSCNIIRALDEANKIGCESICFLGSNNGLIQNCAKIILNIPSNNIPRIQEGHLLLLHILCDLVERLIMQKQ